MKRNNIRKFLELVPELNDKQLNRLSEFLSNLSLLVVASLVIPNVLGPNKPNIFEIIDGIIITILLLSFSIILLRKNL